MTFEAYINPDFTLSDKLFYFTICLAGILFSIIIIYIYVRIKAARLSKYERAVYIYEATGNLTEKFFEMLISATSIMSFACAYIIVNHVYQLASVSGRYQNFTKLWESGKDFLLLLMICLSCLLNTLLDKCIIRLKLISREDIASLRLLAMFYVIVILLYLNNIGDESEYSPVMLYYLGLMIGRFVYFDASFKDFVNAIVNAFKNIGLMLLGLLPVAIISSIGFDLNFLLERNYFIVGVFYTQLFLLLSVFLIHTTKLIRLIARKPKNYDKLYECNEYDEEEYDEDVYETNLEYIDFDEYEE